jgi:hypothetical protein
MRTGRRPGDLMRSLLYRGYLVVPFASPHVDTRSWTPAAHISWPNESYQIHVLHETKQHFVSEHGALDSAMELAKIWVDRQLMPALRKTFWLVHAPVDQSGASPLPDASRDFRQSPATHLASTYRSDR